MPITPLKHTIKYKGQKRPTQRQLLISASPSLIAKFMTNSKWNNTSFTFAYYLFMFWMHEKKQLCNQLVYLNIFCNYWNEIIKKKYKLQ